jgi:preprotein translocase SecE subunit
VPRAPREGLVGYFRGVWEELKKVVWPARDELARMTGIVIATVVLFGVLIGGADYLLSLGVKPLYTSSGTSKPTTNQQVTQTFAPVIPRPHVSAFPTAPVATKPSAHPSASP